MMKVIMRRFGFFALTLGLAFAAPALLAQVMVHGTPASVTSLSPAPSGHFGIPASVTSLTPVNQFCCGGSNFVGGSQFSGGVIFGGHHHHFGGGINGRFGFGRLAVPVAVPVYVPYSYPYYGTYSSDVYEEPRAESRPDVREEEDTREALTMFENRPRYRSSERSDDSRYGEHYTDTRERKPAASEAPVAPPAEVKPPAEQEKTVLVFRDGHQLEVGNYAIVGSTLYDLSARSEHDHRGSKILLADLDIAATVKLNDDRGVEFRVPSTSR